MNVDQVIRSRRKTFALIVQPDGRLVVRAPLRATRAQIEALVKQKEKWIRAKQAEMQAHRAQVPLRSYASGERFLYLGSAYPLVLVDAARPMLALDGQAFRLARAALPEASRVFKAWYLERAHLEFTQRTALFAQAHSLSYSRLRIMDARTRWGSCTTQGSLNFNWRLVMAPPPVIDYVLIHELAHLKVRSHSKDFWSLVERWMPDYSSYKTWLKDNGHLLVLP